MIAPRLHQMPASLDVLRGAKEIALFINTSPARVYKLHRARQIKTFVEGSTICARKSTLIAWVEQQENKS